ncbi:MAG: ribosome biogenesis GTP-binding protein YihA/YsxC [Mycoplasmataceae bacterium]|jgi:GTP-binding protein|nr:ribosome biogenesis GTP-binding protein YihA/YsxC [Mycoplasmataceae bacterium]
MSSFIRSFSEISQLPNDSINEYCFIGRSNVGKSSIINSILKENIAKSSSTPGKTKLINFFQFKKIRLVDLPGYGFANVSKSEQEKLADLIFKYLTTRKNIQIVFLICDFGVITPQDKETYDYLIQNGLNVIVLLNKIDRYSNNEINSQLPKIIRYLNIIKENTISISSKKNININKIIGYLK